MRSFLWKRLGAVFLAILLICSTGSALAGIAGLDAVLSGWLWQDRPLLFSLSTELQIFLPLSESKTNMINRLLGHLSFASLLEQDSGNALSALALFCDDDELFSMTEQETSGSYTLETPLLPRRIFQSQEASALDRLFGEDATQKPTEYFDLPLAISETEACYKALTDACEPYAEKKKANYKIKNIGTAKWGQIVRLTAEQNDEIAPLLQAVLQCGMDADYRTELEGVRFGKGFTVALYKTEENGDDLALYLKGTLIYPDKSTATLTYQWALASPKGERKDAYRYELSRKIKPAASRIIDASLTRQTKEGAFLFKESSVLTLKQNKVTTVQTQKADLAGKGDSSSRTLTGTVSHQEKVTKDGKSQTTLTTTTPHLTLTAAERGTLLSGTVQSETKIDKRVTSSLLFTFDSAVPPAFPSAAEGLYVVAETNDFENSFSANSVLEIPEEDSTQTSPINGNVVVTDAPIGMQRFSAPENQMTVFLDELSEAELADLQDEFFQNLASRLVLAFAKLPKDELALFADGLTPEDSQRLWDLFNNL